MLSHHTSFTPRRGRAAAGGRTPSWRACSSALVLWLALLAGPLAAVGGQREGSCSSGSGQPELRIETELGTITLELFEGAAPRSLQQLREQLASSSGSGYFENATFAYTRPHREVRLTGSADQAKAIDVQLDAETLGLDDDRVTDEAEAMAIVQHELLVAFADNGKRVIPGSRLESWLERWYENRDPAFLVGASRREVNEALGYRYESGLASRPAERGMVALRPASPTEATPSLTFLLSDMPERTGRWMVIGRVAEGLEILEQIALRPRAPGMAGHKHYRPAKPLRALAVDLVCEGPPTGSHHRASALVPDSGDTER